MVRGREKKITAMIPNDLVEWMEGKIAIHRFHNYTHAIVNALQEMKDRDEAAMPK